MIELLGTIVMVLSFGMVFLGLPRQILKNYREDKCGVDIVVITLPMLIFATRIWYSYLIGAWFLIAPDLAGVFLSVVILVQYFRPRAKICLLIVIPARLSSKEHK